MHQSTHHRRHLPNLCPRRKNTLITAIRISLLYSQGDFLLCSVSCPHHGLFFLCPALSSSAPGNPPFCLWPNSPYTHHLPPTAHPYTPESQILFPDKVPVARLRLCTFSGHLSQFINRTVKISKTKAHFIAGSLPTALVTAADSF